MLDAASAPTKYVAPAAAAPMSSISIPEASQITPGEKGAARPYTEKCQKRKHRSRRKLCAVKPGQKIGNERAKPIVTNPMEVARPWGPASLRLGRELCASERRDRMLLAAMENPSAMRLANPMMTTTLEDSEAPTTPDITANVVWICGTW